MTSFSKRIEAAIERFVRRLLGFREFERLIDAARPYTALTFASRILEVLGVRVELSGEPVDTIPASGPLLVIANHPLGFIDGMALDALLLSRRPDVTILAWYLVADIPGIGDHYTYVDPLQSEARRHLNVRGWRRAYDWLKQGRLLAVFPSGSVARLDLSRSAVIDPPWSAHIARVARRTRVPVLPVYVEGRNGWLFQLSGLVFRRLHESLIVRDIPRMRNRTLRVVIGRIIPAEELARFATDEEASDFMRQKTEALAPVS